MSVAILVVDDEPDLELLIRQRFRKRVRAAEWTFHFAQSGQEALDVLREEPSIQLILTDINMPGMDGLTLLDHVQRLDRMVKAVVVSAYGDMSNIRVAMNRGAFDFVTKPVDFNDLETTIDKGVRELVAYNDALRASQDLVELQRELAVARRIQRAFLPGRSLTHGQVAIEACLEPAREVGGDFYDFFPIDARRLGLVVGDVAGKGVSAALFMAITRTLIQAVALQGQGPGPTLEQVNRLLYPQSLSEVFVTVVLAVIDLDEGRLAYVTAGHPAPYRISGGEVAALTHTRGLGLCLSRDARYTERVIDLSPGDAVFFFTDGITEAARADGALFEDERLRASLAATAGAGPAAQLRRVLDDVAAFTAGHAQSDDLTALVLHWRG